MISSTSLFLGILVNEEMLEALNKISPPLRALLIRNHDACLNEIDWEHGKLLGKSAGTLTNLQQLEFLKDNVYSLLKKILPVFLFSEEDLILVALAHNG